MVSIFIPIFEHTEVFPWRILEVEPRDIGHKLLKIPVPSDSNTITTSPISVPQRLIFWGLCIHPGPRRKLASTAITPGKATVKAKVFLSLAWSPWWPSNILSLDYLCWLLSPREQTWPFPQSGVFLIQVPYWPLHLIWSSHTWSVTPYCHTVHQKVTNVFPTCFKTSLLPPSLPEKTATT